MSKEINVAVTGAAGNIGYALLPKIVDGLFLPPEFGKDYRVNLSLLEIPQAMSRLEGNAMELEDLASPHLGEIRLTDSAQIAFQGINLAFLLGGIPRKEGMTRADLLTVNAPLFVEQGRALNDGAADDIKVVVVSNPANSIALTTLRNSPDIPVERYVAMSRLDHNRAVSQLAIKAQMSTRDIEHLAIWGNHSKSMVVDISNVHAGGIDMSEWNVPELAEPGWYEQYIEKVADRGTAVIDARGSSSAMSAASAAADTARDWVNGSGDRWHSMGLYSQGQYGIPEGVVSSYPVTTSWSGIHIVPDLGVSKEMRGRLDATADELLAERQALIDCGAI